MNLVEQDQGDNGGGTTVVTRHQVSCEVCHLPFPSRAVLEHHLMGSRHARKVKAESVLRELQVKPQKQTRKCTNKNF